MIEITTYSVNGIRPAIAGMRFAKKSEDRSNEENDLKLIETLQCGGNPHNKFLRQITVNFSIVAPRAVWPQIDTYRMGVEKNSESIMHTITKKEFTYDDFQWQPNEDYEIEKKYRTETLGHLNHLRSTYLMYKERKDKRADDVWRELVDKLPQSYLQKRMMVASYAVLQKMYHERKNHKMAEWHEICRWIESLPLSWLITMTKPQDLDQDEITKMKYELVNHANEIESGNSITIHYGYGKQKCYPAVVKILEIMDRCLFDDIDFSFIEPDIIKVLDSMCDKLSEF